MSELRQYELVYVASPELSEEGVTELHEQVDEIVTGLGGRIEKTDNWGRRRLAYEIGKHREGTYVIELIEAPGTIVGELDRKLKVRDTVLRHLVVRVDEDLKKARRSREKRQSWQQRRRAARGLPPIPVPDSVTSPSPGASASSSVSTETAAKEAVASATPEAPAPTSTEDAPAAPAEKSEKTEVTE